MLRMLRNLAAGAPAAPAVDEASDEPSGRSVLNVGGK